ncbi:MAG: HRDC domain-containing protein [Bacteroidales bacterium]|nr:HRDC domain-containing protein [Bacteroidales bacterium]
MQIKLFTVPITDSGSSIEEVNRFLRANKILEVENQLVSNERGATWCFCVKYLPVASTYQKHEKTKTDYKTILSEEKFKVFSELRALRKQIAYKDAVPAYTVCTDQELAEIVQLPVINQATLKTVKGFGDKKVEKYGLAFIEWYEKQKG